jgi:transposase
MAARGAGPKSRCPAAIAAIQRFLYRYRNLVERFFSKLKHFLAVAVRFEGHSENYLAFVKLASAKIWMRFMSR